MDPIFSELPGLQGLGMDLSSHLGSRSKRSRRKKSRGGRVAADIQLEDLQPWFHVPSDVAANKLGISGTLLKRVCRRLGIPRWPYKKLTKADRMQAGIEEWKREDGNVMMHAGSGSAEPSISADTGNHMNNHHAHGNIHDSGASGGNGHPQVVPTTNGAGDHQYYNISRQNIGNGGNHGAYGYNNNNNGYAAPAIRSTPIMPPHQANGTQNPADDLLRLLSSLAQNQGGNAMKPSPPPHFQQQARVPQSPSDYPPSRGMYGDDPRVMDLNSGHTCGNPYTSPPAQSNGSIIVPKAIRGGPSDPSAAISDILAGLQQQQNHHQAPAAAPSLLHNSYLQATNLPPVPPSLMPPANFRQQQHGGGVHSDGDVLSLAKALLGQGRDAGFDDGQITNTVGSALEALLGGRTSTAAAAANGNIPTSAAGGTTAVVANSVPEVNKAEALSSFLRELANRNQTNAMA